MTIIPDITHVSNFVSKRLLKVVEFDDRVDQLNYLITPTLILVFASIVSAKIYGGQPMNCLLPTNFSPELRKYAMDYCFIENVYFVGLKEEIPSVVERESREFKYYQWVPYLLVLQAALFNIPIWVWKNHYRQSEVNPDLVMREARKIRTLRDDLRRRMMDVLSGDVADCLDLDERQRAFRQTMWYLLTKILFLLNILLQFVLLGSFIGRGYNAWCWNVFISVFGLDDPFDDRWVTAPVFPTDALCDFVVRQLGNSHRHTIQCMLMINQFNEKMFLFFTVYFFLVGVITLLNTLCWILALLVPSERYNLVRRLIKKDKLVGQENCEKIRSFTDNALKTDGILLLHFIKGTAGAFVARDVCTQLFVAYGLPNLSAVTLRGTDIPQPIGFKSPKGIGFKNNNLKKQFNQLSAEPQTDKYYKPITKTDTFVPEAEALYDNDYNKALQSNEETESSLSNSNEEDTNFANSGFGNSAFGTANNAGAEGFASAGFGSNPPPAASGFGTGGFSSGGFGGNSQAKNNQPAGSNDWDNQPNGSWG